MTTMPSLPAQGTTNWFGWAQAAHTNLVNAAAITSDGVNITVTGTVAATTVRGSSVASLGPLVLTEQSSDPAGSAGLVSVWAKTDGSLNLRTGTGTVTRVPVYWGSGIILPSVGIGVGDTYVHTGLGPSLMRYNGTSWRQAERAEVANSTALATISGSYSALLYVGFEVLEVDNHTRWMWGGSGWLFPQATPIYIASSAPSSALDGSLWFQTP